MSQSEDDILINGKPLSALRVVDLKEELEKRGLSKSGNKKELTEKLRLVSTKDVKQMSIRNDDSNEK
jgi:predicted acetyltransferase